MYFLLIAFICASSWYSTPACSWSSLSWKGSIFLHLCNFSSSQRLTICRMGCPLGLSRGCYPHRGDQAHRQFSPSLDGRSSADLSPIKSHLHSLLSTGSSSRLPLLVAWSQNSSSYLDFEFNILPQETSNTVSAISAEVRCFGMDIG